MVFYRCNESRQGHWDFIGQPLKYSKWICSAQLWSNSILIIETCTKRFEFESPVINNIWPHQTQKDKQYHYCAYVSVYSLLFHSFVFIIVLLVDVLTGKSIKKLAPIQINEHRMFALFVVTICSDWTSFFGKWQNSKAEGMRANRRFWEWKPITTRRID